MTKDGIREMISRQLRQGRQIAITNQIRDVYNSVLTERIPDDMRRLVEGLR